MAGQAEAALAAYEIISGFQQAEIIRGQAEITKYVNEMNAQYAELDAYEAEKTGLTEEARYQTNIDKTISAQKVGLAAQDIDINFGTTKEIQTESKLVGFLNQVDIRNQAHAKALGYKAQARNLRLAGFTAASEGAGAASAAQNAALMRGGQTGISAWERYGGTNDNPLSKPKSKYGAAR
jgi:hypothetical protein